jgi:[ribosomal protein S18]-alanine N-acetyltransferase
MAVLSKLRDFWQGFQIARPKTESKVMHIPASPPASASEFAAAYEIKPLKLKHLNELDVLDRRCFTNGEAYTRHTLEYLLKEPTSLAYRVVSRESGEMIGFVIGIFESDGTGHITTIGVAPDHRRRGVAYRLLERAEQKFYAANMRLVRLEVRTDNEGAQELYRRAGYSAVQRIAEYYSNGEDALLMVKSLV